MRSGVTIQVSGGLGNQLFMLTAAASLLKFDAVQPCNIDLTTVGTKRSPHASGIGNLKLEAFVGQDLDKLSFFRSSPIQRFLERKISPKNIESLEQLGFSDLSVVAQSNQVRLVGYFQSEKYLHEARMRSWPLNLEPNLPSDMFFKAREFFANESVAFIHIRRGDYIFHKESLGVLGAEYFQSGVEALIGKGFTSFCVISDDVEWADQIVHSLPSANYFSISAKFDLTDEETLSIASEAPAIVISNSSFGYWAGMAGGNKAIVAPSNWFRRLAAPESLFVSPEIIFCESVWIP